MKKVLFYSIALLTTCAILMVGCQPKDEPQPQDPTEQQPGEPEQQQAQPVKALMNYTYEVSEQMIEVGDITINYYDNEGKLQSEVMTTTKWNKVIVAALPAKLGVQVKPALKEGVDYSKYEVFSALRKYEYKAYCLDADGNLVGKEEDIQKGSNTSTLDIPGDQIEAFFNKYKDKPLKQTLYKVDEKGVFTYLDEWE